MDFCCKNNKNNVNFVSIQAALVQLAEQHFRKVKVPSANLGGGSVFSNAGVVQWHNATFPRLRRGSDSLHPLKIPRGNTATFYNSRGFPKKILLKEMPHWDLNPDTQRLLSLPALCNSIANEPPYREKRGFLSCRLIFQEFDCSFGCPRPLAQRFLLPCALHLFSIQAK